MNVGGQVSLFGFPIVTVYGQVGLELDLGAHAVLRGGEGDLAVVIESRSEAAAVLEDEAIHRRNPLRDEGRDLLLGNSPNRVMPGRLVERVAQSDKIVAGLRPVTVQLIGRLYERIVTGGELHRTSSLTAEVVKTLENASRLVRRVALQSRARARG